MMTVVATPRPTITQTPSHPTNHPRWRLAILCMLLLISIGFNIYILVTTSTSNNSAPAFVTTWLFSYLPYIAASLLVLVMKPQAGRMRWIELGLLLIGALILRALLLPIPPKLSEDSWRYLWDARVTLHGYSPYVYAPGDPRFAALRDFIYDNSRFRSVPTIYPPGAQGIYLLSYLVAPSNLYVLKGIFLGLDLVTCGALAYMLYRKGLDMSRCIIYAWSPLPILEFAIQGHLDASTIAFSMLALLCASTQWRGSRVLTGFLIALATLTKLYPILLLVVVIRRRDWALLVTCFATIILAYTPYLIMGHGQVFGFFSTYASEQTPNAGIVQQIFGLINARFAMNRGLTTILIYICDIILVVSVAITILRLRWQERMSMEAGALLMIGTIFAASSHIFPWYTAAFLPWIALLIGPLWSQKSTFNATSLAVLFMWYFSCIAITAYFFQWNTYYIQVYDVTLLGLGIALAVHIWQKRHPLNEEQRNSRNAFRVKWLVDRVFRLSSDNQAKKDFSKE